MLINKKALPFEYKIVLFQLTKPLLLLLSPEICLSQVTINLSSLPLFTFMNLSGHAVPDLDIPGFVEQTGPPAAIPHLHLDINSKSYEIRSCVWNLQNLDFFELPDMKTISPYPFYVRQSTRDLWTFLRHCYDSSRPALANQPTRLAINRAVPIVQSGPIETEVIPLEYVHICGCSGTGKTSIVTAYFASETSARFRLFITNMRASKTQYYALLVTNLGNNAFRYDRWTNLLRSDIRVILKHIPIDSPEAVTNRNIIVFDGNEFGTTNPMEEFAEELIARSQALIIQCASYDASRMTKRLVSLTSKVSFYISGFTFEELCEAKYALQDGNQRFYHSTLVELSQWYYYIGGNFRNFLRMSLVQDCMDNVTDCVNAIGDVHSLLTGHTACVSNEQGSQLIDYQCTQGYFGFPKVVLISRYVAEILLSRGGLHCIAIAKQILPDNMVYQDWLFKSELVARALLVAHYSADTLTFYDSKSQAVMSISHHNFTIVRFHHLNDLQYYGFAPTKQYRMFVPCRYQNLGYDAILVEVRKKSVVVYILQATLDKTHTCDLASVGVLLDHVFRNTSGDGRLHAGNAWVNEPVLPANGVPAQLPNPRHGLTMNVHYCIITSKENRFRRSSPGSVDISHISPHNANFSVRQHPIWIMEL